jgi:hypothetical protein
VAKLPDNKDFFHGVQSHGFFNFIIIPHMSKIYGIHRDHFLFMHGCIVLELIPQTPYTYCIFHRLRCTKHDNHELLMEPAFPPGHRLIEPADAELVAQRYVSLIYLRSSTDVVLSLD